MPDVMRLITGTAHSALAEEIAVSVGVPLCDVEVSRFSDGEIFVKINENVRGTDCFIIQPTHSPAENLLELLLLIDAVRRASARRITAVVPYFGYARQDRKDQPRVAISAKLCANLVTTAGADRLLTIDFHAHQLQGFFDIPVDHLYAAPILLDYLLQRIEGDCVVVAPDIGAMKMARGFARRLNATIAVIDKRRPKANKVDVMSIVGEVKGKTAIVLDDMIDTGGTFASACNLLAEKRVKEVLGGCTHGILSDGASERLQSSAAKEVVVTNTLPMGEEKRFPKLKILSVAELLAKAISYIHREESVSRLFVE